uniref:Uncharacterized protein n=1 Tax=Oryza sativa subsp. japonica TaxID=39947 RepID=Q6Z895_ORYSJ|nr:hypothetical protein [Oryza sativa Japonica Group]BAD07904.1 hypothetical protein [Oryza sativa Japonica Group]
MVRTPGGSGEGVEERSGEVELVARRATRQCRGSGETGHRRQERRAGGGSRGNKRGSATTGEGRWLAGGRGGVQRWPPEEEAVHRALLPPPLWSDFRRAELAAVVAKEDTALRAAIPVRQRITVCVWRLAMGEPLSNRTQCSPYLLLRRLMERRGGVRRWPLEEEEMRPCGEVWRWQSAREWGQEGWQK